MQGGRLVMHIRHPKGNGESQAMTQHDLNYSPQKVCAK
jgi:hypothetical protein